ncbi:hypothetical protein PHYC_02475 [Phycisphaerales bacterium]|nr:hypothetical protein PHYC_02475 [Phycisphaerales bacterium]
MNTDQFWGIIDAAALSSKGHQGKFLSLTQAALKKLPPTEILEFKLRFDEQMRRAFHWDLWGAAYIIRGGCSDDGFEYFRAWLISNGRKVFEEGLARPESLVNLKIEEDDCEFEDLIFAAGDVYEAATGADLYADLPIRAPVADQPAGKPWGEDSRYLEQRFPRLWARFNGSS